MNLDVAASRAKLDRAEKHLRAYDGELERLKKRNPYTLRVSEVDNDTGWCNIYLRADPIGDIESAIIVGDFINNLRTALDYLITLLLDASNGHVNEKHGFPIHTERRFYEANVERGGKPNSGGPLKGIQHGLPVILGQQPFNYSGTDPSADSLALMQRFSNTDKHRHLVQTITGPVGSQHLTCHYGQGTVIEQWQAADFRVALGEEVKIMAIRFATPYPAQVRVEGQFTVLPLIAVPPFPPRFPLGHAVSLDVLADMHRRVAETINQIEQL